jgi:hypothetical protein
MNNSIPARISVQFFVAAAFLGVFGFINSNADGSSPVPSLILTAACAGAGIAVRTGTPNARLVGLAVASVTVVYGVISLFGQHYLPGSIVATFALVRLASAGAAFTGGAPVAASPYPAGPYGQPQYPQQPQYGQPPAPPAEPTAGDPRFG